jgi:hypothetical protein
MLSGRFARAALTASVLSTLIVVPFAEIASASESGNRHAGTTHRAHRAERARHRHRLARPAFQPAYGYGYGYGYASPAPYGYAGRGYAPGFTPGYTFVPGHGIVDEDCDLPTSACSNQYRLVR